MEGEELRQADGAAVAQVEDAVGRNLFEELLHSEGLAVGQLGQLEFVFYFLAAFKIVRCCVRLRITGHDSQEANRIRLDDIAELAVGVCHGALFMDKPVLECVAGDLELIFDTGGGAAVEGDDHIRFDLMGLVQHTFKRNAALEVQVGKRILAQNAVKTLGYGVEEFELLLVEGDVLPAEEEDALALQGGEELVPCAGGGLGIQAVDAVENRQFRGGEITADGKHTIADGYVDVNGAGAVVVHFQECFVEQPAAVPVVFLIGYFGEGDGIFGDIREQGRLVYHLVFQLVEEIGVFICRDDNQGNVAAVGLCDPADVIASGGTGGTHDGDRCLDGLSHANGKEGCAALVGDAVCLEERVFIYRADQGVVAVAGGDDDVADTTLLEHGDYVERTFMVSVHMATKEVTEWK